MRKQLFAASVGGDEVVLCKGGELLASRTTAAQWHIRRPLIINGLSSLLSDVRTGVILDFNLPEESPDSTEIDSLPRPAREAVIESLKALASSSRFRQHAADGTGRLVRVEDGVEWIIPFPDPNTLTHGITVLSAGPRGGERSNALWHALVGSEVEIVGPTRRDVDWVALDDVPRSRVNPGHDVAALLGVAAARLPDGSAVVVADRSARTAVLARAPEPPTPIRTHTYCDHRCGRLSTKASTIRDRCGFAGRGIHSDAARCCEDGCLWPAASA